MSRITETVKTLLIANVLFFVGSELLGNEAIRYFALWFPQNENFHFWQIISHMFMHGSLTHIFFNMFALWMFGSIMEQSLGAKKFVFLYFISGLGAVALQLGFSYYNYYGGLQTLADAGMSSTEIHELMERAYAQWTSGGSYSVNIPEAANQEAVKSMLGTYMTPMVGASGAVFGILAGFALLYPNLPLYLFFVPIPIKAKYLIGGYFILEVYSGVSATTVLGPSNTAHWAHVGGAIIGFLTLWFWKRNQPYQNQWGA